MMAMDLSPAPYKMTRTTTGNILPAGGEKIFPFSLSTNNKEHERKSASIRNAMRQLEFMHVTKARSWSP
jgi:hypothetical protein